MATKRLRKITKVGDSEHISLDPGWLRYMRSEGKLKGRQLEMIVDGEQIIIRPPKETDIDVYSD